MDPHGQAQHAGHDPGDFVAEEARVHAAHPNYVGVFVFLGILTAIEIGLVRLFPETIGRVPILLTLTFAKGLLVVLYYMHLKFDSKIYAWFFGIGIFAFGLPLVLSLLFLMSPPVLAPPVAHGGPGEGGPREAPPTRNPNAGPPVSETVEGGEFFFRPDALAANSGQRVNLTLVNVGTIEHNFTLANVPVAEDAQPWTSNNGKLIAQALGGQRGNGGFFAPASGAWAFWCSIPGHVEAGMHGTLTVR
jgi:cytochrome c oxidase subunit 4